MLKLQNICKSYAAGKNKIMVLDNINIEFDSKGLVFILGESGSGKSTLLNIIAMNLDADSGEIWLDNVHVNKLSQKKLDGYRTNIIGNVFQDYNLIEYMSVIDNVKLNLDTHNGVNLDSLLNDLSIYDKRLLRVSRLSGGEKQRVAIARALANNPRIILADEPTGALDSKNSIEVMEILKKISKEKLVIVVSHDVNLANRYASRIISIKDGKCECLPEITCCHENTVDIKKPSRKYMSIFKLAIKNLLQMKMRFFLTSLAISLGIISVMIVSNLYYNFNNELDEFEKNTVSLFPISISNGEYEIANDNANSGNSDISIKDSDSYVNVITKEYIDYLDSMNDIKYLTNGYNILLPFVSDSYKIIDNNYFLTIPNDKYISDNFDILYGNNVSNKYEILLKLDSNNNIDAKLLKYFDISNNINYSDIVGRKIKVILNDQYYIKEGKYYVVNNDMLDAYNNSYIELKIVGVIKEKDAINESNYIYYDNQLLKDILDINSKSSIVMDQLNTNYNVLGLTMNKEELLSYLGYNSLPNNINLYVDTLADKDKVIKMLDEYNKSHNKVIYVDTMSSAIDLVKQFINIISSILIAFSLIAIVVSSFMIAILTNVRVLERKKEIGIFRSLGASRADIRNLFKTENTIIGILAMVISYVTCLILINPINSIMSSQLGIDNLFKINYVIMGIIFIFILFVIKLSGTIPARKASKLSIVNCIYNR